MSMTIFEPVSKDIAELLDEAAEARSLAFALGDAAAIRDLLAYAAALEIHAARLNVLRGLAVPEPEQLLGGWVQQDR
jgi:hypothetical protein